VSFQRIQTDFFAYPLFFKHSLKNPTFIIYEISRRAVYTKSQKMARRDELIEKYHSWNTLLMKLLSGENPVIHPMTRIL